jgi:hypothetical protein
MNLSPWCICTTVSAKALENLLHGGGRGTYRDRQPWLVARDLLKSAGAAGQRLPLMLAAGTPPQFSHWAFIESLEVLELHRSSWETACTFTALKPVHPIFQEIDSLFLQPAAERLERERREGITRHRYPLSAAELHPYAICETPAFMIVEE